ncbi:Uncharacterized protein MCB1EB_1487 [Mycoavidus cysteinexigens]|uniref:Uncharacterized protein n=1 Tax=Mycoavidus cysteinexigens TaxID=1553431 RepID=A0A2Z6EW68_9BURK|nr:hypothetical protein [Mycoavidus cysteinexigens]BBE09648.1 Uncharacterized protein MCB1EB_1487 [Mycoavidus cysteinexigens]
MKRPAFQFYPADWRKDSALQSCSVAARGLWIEMLCIMHECEPYGQLAINGKAMSATQLARLIGETEKVVKGLLAELENAGVFSCTEQGGIYSRRMVNDERLRNIRAEGGKGGKEYGQLGAEHGCKGGRPKKDKGGYETKPKTPLTDEKYPSPSSSSSSSPSSSKPKGDKSPSTPGERDAPAVTLPNWLALADWEAFVKHRKRLKAPMSDEAQVRAIAQLSRLRDDGHDPSAVIDQSIVSSWKGLFGLNRRGLPKLSKQAELEARNAEAGRQAKALIFGEEVYEIL